MQRLCIQFSILEKKIYNFYITYKYSYIFIKYYFILHMFKISSTFKFVLWKLKYILSKEINTVHFILTERKNTRGRKFNELLRGSKRSQNSEKKKKNWCYYFNPRKPHWLKLDIFKEDYIFTCSSYEIISIHILCLQP